MAAGERILVVEDESPVREMLVTVLREAGFVPTSAPDGLSGLRSIQTAPPDLVLLDVQMSPGPNGREVLRRLRADAATAHLPIIVLTGQQEDQLEGTLLEEGADDYIRKGFFRARVLVERIKAVLRRSAGSAAAAVIRTPHLVVHPGRREALVDGRPVNLTPTEFDILMKLASHPDRVLTRRELIDRGADDGEGDDRTVDVHVLSIRRKLEKHAWLVSTVWGAGYRLGSAPGA